MKEDFLHFLWKQKLFDFSRLQTIDKKPILIENFGQHNVLAGPDFLDAKVKIDDQLWAGNIEMHLKSSDWYIHQHETDENYDAVILHVVWQHDADVFGKDDQPIPTLVISNYVQSQTLSNYKSLFAINQRWIPCEKDIATMNSFLMNNWLERLYFERLQDKTKLINEILQESSYDWEQTCFRIICKGFGLKINGEAFLLFAKSTPFSIVRKLSHNEDQLSALFFGQSGLLEDDIEDGYFKFLKSEYEYLRHKFSLQPIAKNHFQFFRVRPHNFPTVRMAQLVALYHRKDNFFHSLMQVNNFKDFENLFSVEVNNFWQEHYHFSNTSKKSKKKPTRKFLELLMINTLLPLRFCYEQSLQKVDVNFYIEVLTKLKPEKNSIIEKFSSLGIGCKNAMESQSLLELKNNYCAKKRCLQCAIGNHLLKS